MVTAVYIIALGGSLNFSARVGIYSTFHFTFVSLSSQGSGSIGTEQMGFGFDRSFAAAKIFFCCVSSCAVVPRLFLFLRSVQLALIITRIFLRRF